MSTKRWKKLPRQLSMQTWYKQWESCKLYITSGQPRMSPSCAMKPGVIQIQNHEENSMSLFKRNLGTWTSNRYGEKPIIVLCPQLIGMSRIGGYLKLSIMVCTRHDVAACRYSQVPDINFSENYSLVVNNITFKILLLLVITCGYSVKKVDVETMFLYGDLQKEIYIECPQGMSAMDKYDCIILNKCICGLVHSMTVLQECYQDSVETRTCGRLCNPMPLC